MKVFKGKTAPWYIALFAVTLALLFGLYIWTVPSAGRDQSLVASLLLIATAVCVVLMGVPIKRNWVEVHLGDPVADDGGSGEDAPAHVDVVYGIWRTRIELADITAVERTRSLLAMGTQVAASSTDCVRIFTRAGGIMVVALEDNQGFIDLLSDPMRGGGA